MFHGSHGTPRDPGGHVGGFLDLGEGSPINLRRIGWISDSLQTVGLSAIC